MRQIAWIGLITLLLWLPVKVTSAQTADPLPSWTDGTMKTSIVEFVQAVTKQDGPKYVPPEQRIATFDNDGTLWCEQPVAQVAYSLYQIKQMAPDHPEWKDKQPFKAALEDDEKYFVDDLKAGGHEIMQVFAATHAGMSAEDFNDKVRAFFKSARHPKYNVPYAEVRYLPMVELLQYLRANGFKTYLCSGGGIDFMRVISNEAYGIVPENVVGSNARNVFEEKDGKWQIVKTAEHLFVNDQKGKPVGIDLHIGRKPIFSAGNVRSGGDIAHLTYCHSNKLPAFQLLINHDDEKREYAYAEKDNASLAAAKEQGWRVVNIKDDWQRVFEFQK